VDLWYLGGWCLYCQGERLRDEREKGVTGKGKGKEAVGEDENDDDWQSLWQSAREWLNNCAQLYQTLEWDDEQLHDHAAEILCQINEVLGENMEEDEKEGEDQWEDADSEAATDDGEAMEDS